MSQTTSITKSRHEQVLDTIDEVTQISSNLGIAQLQIEDEELSKLKGGGHTYFENTTYKELLNYAQNDLFKGQDLSDLNPAFNCSCTN